MRATLERAKAVLNTVNFNPLSNERKKAYNDAEGVHPAGGRRGEADRNYVFAQSLATKAETLATELAGR